MRLFISTEYSNHSIENRNAILRITHDKLSIIDSDFFLTNHGSFNNSKGTTWFIKIDKFIFSVIIEKNYSIIRIRLLRNFMIF